MTETVGRGRPRTGARALARRAVKAQVAEMAFDLFVDRGYDETTVDDICAVAGISRSTFFRYFPTKEDVLLGEAAAFGEELRGALEDRPDGEPPWVALRRALRPLIDAYDAEPERRLRLAKLVTATPVLAAHHQEKAAHWQELLRPEVARRLGADPRDATDPRPAALVAAMLGCLDAATAAWAAGDGEPPLTEILDRAMGAI